MPQWVQCTGQSEERPTIYVNLALAAWIAPEGEGSRVAFAGDDDVHVDVAEAPTDLVAKASVSR